MNGDPAGSICTLLVGGLAGGATGTDTFAVTIVNASAGWHDADQQRRHYHREWRDDRYRQRHDAAHYNFRAEPDQER